MHEIVDGLWLGSMFAAYDAEMLLQRKITAVLSCAIEIPVRKDVADAAGVNHALRIPMEDRADYEDTELCIREGAATIDRWLRAFRVSAPDGRWAEEGLQSDSIHDGLG